MQLFFFSSRVSAGIICWRVLARKQQFSHGQSGYQPLFEGRFINRRFYLSNCAVGDSDWLGWKVVLKGMLNSLIAFEMSEVVKEDFAYKF